MNEPTGSPSPDSPRRALLRGSEAVRDALPTLVDRAVRELALFAPHLPAGLFNTMAFSRALASFAARQRQNRVRLLVEDAQQALRDNDRVIALARRLSDTLLIRRVAEDDRGNRGVFLLADHAAYLQQHDLDAAEAILDTRGGPPLAELLQRFDEMWERSEPVALTPLGLSP